MGSGKTMWFMLIITSENIHKHKPKVFKKKIKNHRKCMLMDDTCFFLLLLEKRVNKLT